MPGTHYVGKSGHLAVMGEFALRGYNVAIPEMDVGDDVFVVNDSTGAMWRVQVKTSVARPQTTSERFGFRIKESSIQTAQSPDLHFVFALRSSKGWRFLVIDRAVLRGYVVNQRLGTLAGQFRQVNVVLHNDGRCISSGQDLRNFLEDWARWPVLP